MALSELKFELNEHNGVRVVRVSGPLDSMTFDQFRAYMDPLLSKPHVRIVLDCQGLTYVNSRGVALLMHYHRTTSMQLSFFGITELPPRIVKMVDSLGLGKLLTWYPTLDSAMEVAAAV